MIDQLCEGGTVWGYTVAYGTGGGNMQGKHDNVNPTVSGIGWGLSGEATFNVFG